MFATDTYLNIAVYNQFISSSWSWVAGESPSRSCFKPLDPLEHSRHLTGGDNVFALILVLRMQGQKTVVSGSLIEDYILYSIFSQKYMYTKL